tara:strand:+ start:6663 stop:7199 length:537 start_codon:yes stop_codon:yes gene_type:complete
MFEQLAFIDPVTAGFIITTGAKAIGSMFGSDEEDTKATIDAAKDLSFAEIKETGKEYDINSKAIAQQTSRLLDAATTKGQQSLMNLATQEESMNTDFANNQMATTAVDATRASVYDSYSSNVDTIMEDSQNQITKLDLNTQKQLDAISAELDKNITGALSTADTFTERFLGQSDYEIG